MHVVIETENGLILVIDVDFDGFALNFGYLAAHFAGERFRQSCALDQGGGGPGSGAIAAEPRPPRSIARTARQSTR